MQKKCGEVKAKTDFLATFGQPVLGVQRALRTLTLGRFTADGSQRESLPWMLIGFF